MRIDVITLFPEMCENIMSESIIGRARKAGFLQVCTHQLRDYAFDKHKRVDDVPFGGGKGMLLKAEPIACLIDTLTNNLGKKPYVIYMSPSGKVLTQKKAVELSAKDNLCILCGHYEGVDQRLIDLYVDEEVSIGDYVMTGGEMPAMILTDAVSRMISGVLSEEICFTEESHYSGKLEHSQYTRPAVWRELSVPKVLLNGNHAKIKEWKSDNSTEKTKRLRPDLFNKLASAKDSEI